MMLNLKQFGGMTYDLWAVSGTIGILLPHFALGRIWSLLTWNILYEKLSIVVNQRCFLPVLIVRHKDKVFKSMHEREKSCSKYFFEKCIF